MQSMYASPQDTCIPLTVGLRVTCQVSCCVVQYRTPCLDKIPNKQLVQRVFMKIKYLSRLKNSLLVRTRGRRPTMKGIIFQRNSWKYSPSPERVGKI